MTTLPGKIIINGSASGKAIVTQQPINFTGAMCNAQNLLPGKKAVIYDQHHDLYKASTEGKILVFPSCIGSTHTGLVLLDLVSEGIGPAGMIVQSADSLLVSGIVLADVWFEKTIPIIEYSGSDLFDHIQSGQRLTLEDKTGNILIDNSIL
ncbi:DUF126 domain-containing protein [Temperatibacter marinus]|uniref:DUF126 domain-containing protein n=1 Tax=Temperatibacter marinus TaxID=1456591 RepID=A0AA52EI42_9PROT|nr:DUF126 domain-containing protein [Temperatibacter marinus]WND02929.1 DUF126 domain-containing protein [Temperatibacter marinus]